MFDTSSTSRSFSWFNLIFALLISLISLYYFYISLWGFEVADFVASNSTFSPFFIAVDGSSRYDGYTTAFSTVNLFSWSFSKFYIANYIRDGIWLNDALSHARFRTSHRASVGLTACSGFIKSFSKSKTPKTGISLYYGADDNLLHKITWSDEDDYGWTPRSIFERTDGNSGLACYCNSTSYLFLMNSDKKIEIWWKDYVIPTNNTLDLPYPKREHLEFKQYVYSLIMNLSNDSPLSNLQRNLSSAEAIPLLTMT